MEPACAKACPTDSIQFGPLDELRERAAARLDQLHEAGEAERAAVRGGPGRRRGRRRGVLPAARRARGVRAAAGPGGDHPGPAVDVAARRRGRGDARRARRGRRSRRASAGRSRRAGSGSEDDGERERGHQGRPTGRAAGPCGGAAGTTGADARRWRRKRRAEQPMVPEGGVHLLLRQAGAQPAGLGSAGHRRVPLPRRAGRRLVAARGRRRPHRPPGAEPRPRRPAPAPRAWLSLAALVARPGPPGPVPQHDAGIQGHLTDERRHLAARRLRAGRRGGRRHGADRTAAAARGRRHRGRGAARARRGRLHRRADQRYRRARLA